MVRVWISPERHGEVRDYVLREVQWYLEAQGEGQVRVSPTQDRHPSGELYRGLLITGRTDELVLDCEKQVRKLALTCRALIESQKWDLVYGL